MTELSATVKLRPTRIGFLVRPNDIKSIKRIMRLNACLWGGRLNPIIPVFQRPPKAWAQEHQSDVKGYNIGRGYVQFFEPDVFVEAEQGLFEKLALERPKHSVDSLIVTLDEFICNYSGYDDVYFGLGIFDVLKHKYESERKFELRHKIKAIMPKTVRGDGSIEAIYGCFPPDEELGYNVKAFEDVFQPQSDLSAIELWKEVFLEGAITPLKFTLEHLDFTRSWHDDLTVFIFDPKNIADLIDLWNMRIEPSPVLPVPIKLLDAVKPHLKEIFKSEFRPVKGNNNGVMHRPTIEVSRSIVGANTHEEIVELLALKDFDNYSLKRWRNNIWTHKKFNEGPKFSRKEYECSEKSIKITPDDSGHAEFETISPSFVKKYAGRNARWVNVVSVGSFSRIQWATLLPFNTFDRTWPKMNFAGNGVSISSEGWVFSAKYWRETSFMTLLNSEGAITEWLSRNDIKASMSDPGQNAKQIIDAVDGLRGLYILQFPEILQLLNKMAGGQRIRANDSEILIETFQDRTVSVKEFEKHISTISNRKLPKISSENFIKSGVLKIGLKTKCSYCQATNWRGLDQIDYEVTCDRCLKNYPFPQSNLKRDNGNWHYRVIGPFSIPDYAQGAYSAVLTINAIASLRDRHEHGTYSTSLNLEIDGKKLEVDFAMWMPPSQAYQSDKDPWFIIGEAKSFSRKAIKKKDITQLKIIAKKLPKAAITISVLKEEFSESEKNLIREFVIWDRKNGASSGERRPIILMTGTELFADFSIGMEWEKRGGVYEKHSDYNTTAHLESFAEATQEIYLGVEPYYEWLTKYRKLPKQSIA